MNLTDCLKVLPGALCGGGGGLGGGGGSGVDEDKEQEEDDDTDSDVPCTQLGIDSLAGDQTPEGEQW